MIKFVFEEFFEWPSQSEWLQGGFAIEMPVVMELVLHEQFQEPTAVLS